ncbi:GNAT family N-acetyltransferase [Kocuria atrinae]|uniref:GNAT family N-acetyltransferase n=1 Tax=Kocuria atrinae TaxID=592377 RepID=UPI00030F6D12|nr:GNAT family N-acetyltransferase [Kocuria atrinae]
MTGHRAAGGAASSLPEGYALRPMQPADLDEVYALETALFPEDAWPRRMFDEELAHPTRQYWVLTREQEIVGYAGMMCIPPVADVQTIAVATGHEGKGLGSALLRTLHQAALHSQAPKSCWRCARTTTGRKGCTSASAMNTFTPAPATTGTVMTR